MRSSKVTDWAMKDETTCSASHHKDPARSDSLLFLPGEEGARLLQALFVEGMKPAFQLTGIRCYFYSELILNEGDSLSYRKERVPLAATRPAGVGNCVETLRGHEI